MTDESKTESDIEEKNPHRDGEGEAYAYSSAEGLNDMDESFSTGEETAEGGENTGGTRRKGADLNGGKGKAKHDYLGNKELLPALFLQAMVILSTSVVRAIAMNVFSLPNQIAPGGITGISSMLYNKLGWNAGLTSFVMNIPLFILAAIYINRYFAISTLIATAITSIIMGFTENLIVFTDDVFVAALMSGILNGVALGFLFKINCSTGGTDIIGLLFQSKTDDAKVVWIIFAINAAVVTVNGILFKSLSLIIYSFVGVYVCSYVAEILHRGFVSTYEVKVISSESDEITEFVLNTLHRGGTSLVARGLYSKTSREYLIFVVRKRQAAELKKYVQYVDKEAFFYVTPVHETVGKGFYDDAMPKKRKWRDRRRAAKNTEE